MPASLMQRAIASGRKIDLHAERREHVGRAGARRQRAVAVLGDRHAGARDDESRAGGDVVGAGRVAAGADDVDRVRAGASTRSILARMAVTAPVISSTVSPRTRNAISRPPICEGVASPDIMLSNAAAASSRVSVAPVATLAMSALKFDHDAPQCAAFVAASRRPRPVAAFHAAARSRKFFKIRWPCSEAMLSG